MASYKVKKSKFLVGFFISIFALSMTLQMIPFGAFAHSGAPTSLTSTYDASTGTLTLSGGYGFAPTNANNSRPGFAVFINGNYPNSTSNTSLDSSLHLLPANTQSGTFSDSHNLETAPTSVCVVIYDVNVSNNGTPLDTGKHSIIPSGPDYNSDNNYDENGQSYAINVRDGKIDISRDGSISSDDTGTLGGKNILSGQVDWNGDNNISNSGSNDDSPSNVFFGKTVRDGKVDMDGNGGVDNQDDGPLVSQDPYTCTTPTIINIPPTPVPGCMDQNANNYNSSATEDDGSCQYTLTVTKVGSGTAGTSGSYASGTIVNLTEAADPGWSFVSWSGDADCSDASVTMDHSMTCTATFTEDITPPTPVPGCMDSGAVNYNQSATQDDGSCQYHLTVTTAGTGSGTAGTAGDYAVNTPVSLTQSAAPGSAFTVWSGDADCSDASVTMDHSMTCTATFAIDLCSNIEEAQSTMPNGYEDPNEDYVCTLIPSNSPTPTPVPLTVTITNELGDGEGTVVDDLGQINCDSTVEGSDCSGTYDEGTQVTLTATPKEGSSFEGSWTVSSGTCTGATTPCTVTASGQSLTAHFSLSATPTPTPNPSSSPTPTPTPTPTPPVSHSGSGRTPTPTPTVLGASVTPTPMVLGAATSLPATSFTLLDSLIFSLFTALTLTGMMMLMIGYNALPSAILKRLD